MEMNVGKLFEKLGLTNSVSAMNGQSTASVAALVTVIVVGLLMCFLGLKLIRVWNILVGLITGAGAGMVAAGIIGLEDKTSFIIAAAAGLVLAVLAGIFKKFGVFVYTLTSIFVFAAGIIGPKDWIWMAVCGAIGLVAAIIAMLLFEPLVIIVSALNGGSGAGTAIAALAGLTNVYLGAAIVAVLAVAGLTVQFIMRYREIAKKEVSHANEVKEEISKEQEIEQLRILLDEDEE